MDKINFQNDVTKVNADTFNTFQTNIENAINEVDSNVTTVSGKVLPSGGTVGQVLMKKGSDDYNVKWGNLPTIVDNLTSSNTTMALSANQGRILKGLIDEMYYKSGDTYSISALAIGSGYVTGGKKEIFFPWYIPKNMKNINSITINAINVTVRGVAGGYIVDHETLSNIGGTITATKIDDKTIQIHIAKNNVMSSATNNSPVSIQLNELTLTFE